ncbi:hypothetical protein [Paenibacillus xylanivorans]|uniref:Uncharacterized protein n=1 Tax=Paenibacillus xylanivorans TaxID=1705561 RepID=A0A0M9BJI3_9BACL|nr:hypothetical protein [Paenibacillus xylanivorans]KOY12592.1 hypothetical protein AMS66_29720 [Paenibacillus xylanivorans]
MEDYSIARATNRGWININEQKLRNELKRKRVIVETLGGEGEVVAKSELSCADTDVVLAALYAKYGARWIIEESYPGVFSNEELKTAVDLIEMEYSIIPTQDDIVSIKELFDNYGYTRITMALNMSESCQFGGQCFYVTPQSPYFSKRFDFREALAFLADRKRFYYAVNSEGKRSYDFVDEPTKKQVTYQRSKNGNATVFLDLDNGEEYNI